MERSCIFVAILEAKIAVASLVQLVDFGNRVLRRLNEYRSKLGDLPDTFRGIAADLPLLIHTLEGTKQAIDQGRIDEKTEKALSPVIIAYEKEVEALEQVLERITPTGDSWRNRTTAALKSVLKESNVEKIESVIRRHLETLTYHYATASSTAQALKVVLNSSFPYFLKWLSAPDPYVNHNKALKQCLAATGRWFLESPQYREWKTKVGSFLWLRGIPGCGKTILSSTIIQDLIQSSTDDFTNALAFYYFDFNDSQKQRVQPMLKSIIAQLSRQCQNVPSALELLFSSCGDGSREPSTEALLSTLLGMIPDYPEVYLVLDALDESVERQDLLDVLEQLASPQAKNFHILVTSRAEHDIESTLRPLLAQNFIVSFQTLLVNEDIRRYIRHRWSNDRILKRWRGDDSIREEVEDALMEKANGIHYVLYREHLTRPMSGFFAQYTKKETRTAIFGLEELIRVILAKPDVGLNEKNRELGAALMAASTAGHEGIVEQLIEAGADVNAHDESHDSALYAASYRGHEDIVKLLLTAGADPNLNGGRYGSALQLASYYGNEDMVKLLLSAGADPNLQGGQYGSALQAASQREFENIVRLLKAAGAKS
ncbi:hypothetical protein VTN77DRAFT_4983 [Rasamsonia byssochlamydoides]|uniref:uncharacterized protein n=1 Tax=Rasamsonia byssochlamydoides TaxID=89139 RepID=UPI0037449858